MALSLPTLRLCVCCHCTRESGQRSILAGRIGPYPLSRLPPACKNTGANAGQTMGQSAWLSSWQVILYCPSLDKNKGRMGAVAVDFRQAFDSVRHDTLLCKLRDNFNLQPDLINTLANYFTDRSYYIVSGKHVSSKFPVSGGVPQVTIYLSLSTLYLLHEWLLHALLLQVSHTCIMQMTCSYTAGKIVTTQK